MTGQSELDLNIYYLALSGMQKAIRKNLVVPALRCGAVAHSINSRAMWQRVFTVWGEDCGRNEEALFNLWKWRGNVTKWKDVAPLVETLASGTKTEDMSTLWGIVGEDLSFYKDDPEECPIKKSEVLNEFKHDGKYRKYYVVIPTREKYKKAYLKSEMSSGDWSWEFEKVFDRHDFNFEDDWVLEALEHVYRFDREGQCEAAPILWMNCGRKEPILRVENYDPDAVVIKDTLPIAALDMHTRPGIMAISIFKKRHGNVIDEVCRVKEFGGMIFTHDSQLYNNKAVTETDFQNIWQQLTATDHLYGVEGREWFLKNVRPVLNEIRMWVITKTEDYGGIVDEIARRADKLLK